jgi:hypothetical protein
MVAMVVMMVVRVVVVVVRTTILRGLSSVHNIVQQVRCFSGFGTMLQFPCG